MTNPLLTALMFASAGIGQATEAAPAAADVRQAVQRSLPYLEKEGLAWIEERKCMSCHVVAFTLWSHNEARAGGIQVDAKKLDAWTDWSLSYSLRARQWYKLTAPDAKQPAKDALPDALRPKLKPLLDKPFVTEADLLTEIGKVLTAEELEQHKAILVKRALQPQTGEKNDGGSMATMGQLLVGRSSVKHAKTDAFLEAAPALMARWQKPDGSWRATGQLFSQARPQSEADEVTTAWAVVGLASLGKSNPPIAKSIDAALAYLKKTKPGKSHERLLVQLLIERQFGNAADVQKTLQEVLGRQNADGGWSWIPGGSSDAFATGESLYVLSVAGAVSDPAPIRRAQKYLLDTQHKEGHWEVPPLAVTNPKTAPGRVKRLVPIYDYWGTAWASIGLSRSLERAK